jgi:ABC-type transport system involved in Fe-S cluster assembly fused permease/ATPase subunit
MKHQVHWMLKLSDVYRRISSVQVLEERPLRLLIDLSTIRNANEILAMVDGAVVERGKHDELLEHKGVYSSQWIIQTGDMAGL